MFYKIINPIQFQLVSWYVPIYSLFNYVFVLEIISIALLIL